MTAYYNEIDPQAAQWLRNLIAAGHIAPGEVDDRSIKDVRADDLKGFTQCHFFAGIGVWSHALRSAGWPDDRPVWTGSCPCQPFSAAGKGEGLDDPRHLWPDWFRLIRELRPVVVFGEQVASPDGIAWLDLAQADLEEHSHTVGTVVTCSAGFGGPDIRQRIYWVAHPHEGRGGRDAGAVPSPQGSIAGEVRRVADGAQPSSAAHGVAHANGARSHQERGDDGEVRGLSEAQRQPEHGAALPGRCGDAGGLGDPTGAGLEGSLEQDVPGARRRSEGRGAAIGGVSPCRLADTGHDGRSPRGSRRVLESQASIGEEPEGDCEDRGPGPLNGFWRAADWLFCTDGKWRPVEPGTFPLDTGIAGRLVRLRAYGNAVNAQAAAEFVAAYAAERGFFA